jgi:hypothetical protein
MKKHIDIWDEHLGTILAKQHEMLAIWLQGEGTPSSIYNLSFDLRVQRWLVDQLKYDIPQFRVSFRGKVPTAMELIAIAEAAKFDPEPTYNESNIIITAIKIGSREKTAVRLQPFKEKRWFFDQSEAEDHARFLRQQKEDRQAKLSAGTHDTCDRCGGIFPVENLWKMTVARSENGGKIYSQEMKFCSPLCGESEQITALR